MSKAKELGLSISEEEAQKWAKKYEELEKKYLEEEMGFWSDFFTKIRFSNGGIKKEGVSK